MLGHSYLLGELLLQVRISRVRIGDWLAGFFFLKQRTVGEIPTVDFINNLSNRQDYKPVLTESI
jgi:hypothetical protein